MITIRYLPDLASAALYQWLRGQVRYDQDGRYSRVLWNDGEPLPEQLGMAAGALERIGCPWTAILMQAYRDGAAVTPCHTDSGQTGYSAILSLGAARTLRFHPVADGVGCDDSPGVFIESRDGTVILMEREFQDGWHHQVRADPAINQERLSLVFRTNLQQQV